MTKKNFQKKPFRYYYGSPGLWIPAGTWGARIRKIMRASPAMQRFAAWRHPVALRHDVWDPIPNTPVCTWGQQPPPHEIPIGSA